jgi:hypothetical protein
MSGWQETVRRLNRDLAQHSEALQDLRSQLERRVQVLCTEQWWELVLDNDTYIRFCIVRESIM